MSPEFLLANLIVCLAPGLGVIYTLSVSLGAGLRAGAAPLTAASAAWPR